MRASSFLAVLTLVALFASATSARTLGDSSDVQVVDGKAIKIQPPLVGWSRGNKVMRCALSLRALALLASLRQSRLVSTPSLACKLSYDAGYSAGGFLRSSARGVFT